MLRGAKAEAPWLWGLGTPGWIRSPVLGVCPQLASQLGLHGARRGHGLALSQLSSAAHAQPLPGLGCVGEAG